MNLWQHEETGRFLWVYGDPGTRWAMVPLMYEDDLPEMSDAEYRQWFEASAVVDGVRMGPTWPLTAEHPSAGEKP